RPTPGGREPGREVRPAAERPAAGRSDPRRLAIPTTREMAPGRCARNQSPPATRPGAWPRMPYARWRVARFEQANQGEPYTAHADSSPSATGRFSGNAH